MEADIRTVPSCSTPVRRTWAERLAELKACPWYWGDVSWKICEKLLMLCDDGTFLVRDSRSESHLFTVSYVHEDKVYHSRVEIVGQIAHLGGPLSLERSESVVTLLQHAVQASMSGERHMLMHRRGEEAEASEIRLKTPLSRLSLLPRLQYLCRLKIREHCTTPKGLDTLDVSPTLKKYIAETKYLIPNIDDCIAELERRRTRVLQEETERLRV